MSRSIRFNRSSEIIKARRSDDLEAGPLAEMQLAHELLDPSYFDVEADLTKTAYLNYRYKTPYERTEAFMQAYQKWYAIKQKRDFAREGRRVNKDYLAYWSNRQFAWFWRARQHADAIGMPYGPYIVATMNRAITHGYGRLPSPNQLYTPDMVDHAASQLPALIAAHSVELLPSDCDPRLLAENFVGDPVQLAALDVIEAEVRKAGASGGARRLTEYMRERRVINEAEARRRLGDELVDAALEQRLRNEPRAAQLVDQGQGSAPGCFGYHRAVNPICSACPVAPGCIERAGKLDGLLLAKHGTTELRALNITQGNRERQRRRRERARAGMTMTLQEEKRVLREAGDPIATEKRLKAKKRREEKKAKAGGNRRFLPATTATTSRKVVRTCRSEGVTFSYRYTD